MQYTKTETLTAAKALDLPTYCGVCNVCGDSLYADRDELTCYCGSRPVDYVELADWFDDDALDARCHDLDSEVFTERMEKIQLVGILLDRVMERPGC